MLVLPSDFQQARARLWLLILAMAILTAAWMHASGLALDTASTLTPALSCVGLELLASFYSTWRPEPRFAVSLSGLAQIIAFSACAASLSYAVAVTDGPLWDGTFQALDQSLGLDWLAYLHGLNDHPWLGHVLSLAYQSLMPQLAVVVIVLGFSGRFSAVREFVLAFVMTGTFSVVLSGLVPAMGTYRHFGLRPEDFPALNPTAPYLHLAHLAGLRDGTFQVVSLHHIQGIITFPSVHAALGVLFIRYFWMSQLTRWPGLALNAMLLAATPIDGGHYFVDVAAGALIAVIAVATASFVGQLARNPAGSRKIGAGSCPAGKIKSLTRRQAISTSGRLKSMLNGG